MESVTAKSRSPAAERLAVNVLVQRARKKLSQADLAERAGVSRPTISRIERGDGDFTLAVVDRIAAAFNVDVTELFADERHEEPADDAELERRAAQKSRDGSVSARALLSAVDEAGFPPERYSKAGRRPVER